MVRVAACNVLPAYPSNVTFHKSHVARKFAKYDAPSVREDPRTPIVIVRDCFVRFLVRASLYDLRHINRRQGKRADDIPFFRLFDYK